MGRGPQRSNHAYQDRELLQHPSGKRCVGAGFREIPESAEYVSLHDRTT